MSEDKQKPPITLAEHMRNAANARWAKASKEDKKKHAVMMNKKRWAKL